MSSSLDRVVSQLPVSEWQRQIGLQDEHLCVERTLFFLEIEEQQCAATASIMIDGSCLGVVLLVLREEVLRRTRFVFPFN